MAKTHEQIISNIKKNGTADSISDQESRESSVRPVPVTLKSLDTFGVLSRRNSIEYNVRVTFLFHRGNLISLSGNKGFGTEKPALRQILILQR